MGETTTLSEPEAAAIYYASTQRVDPGETIAVYDLGGGTFDAAVLRKTDEGFEILEKSEFKPDLAKISHLWNQGSVVRSWLLELAEEAFKKVTQSRKPRPGAWICPMI